MIRNAAPDAARQEEEAKQAQTDAAMKLKGMTHRVDGRSIRLAIATTKSLYTSEKPAIPRFAPVQLMKTMDLALPHHAVGQPGDDQSEDGGGAGTTNWPHKVLRIVIKILLIDKFHW